MSGLLRVDGTCRGVSTPRVSVVMPLHNAADRVEAGVRSVQGQSLPDWELLVVDDASTDDSGARVAALAAEDARIRVLRLERNGGPAVARNAGIREARGWYIAFLDSDDVWAPEKLVRQVALMERGAVFSFTAMERVDEQGRRLSAAGVPERVGYGELLKTNYIGCSTVMYDTGFFGKVEMPLIDRRQDYGLWLWLLKQVEFAHGLNEPLVRYTVRSGSVSSNKLTTAGYTWRVYRELEGLSVMRSAYCLAHQTARAAVRNHLPRVARRLGWLHPVDGGVDLDCHGPLGPSQ
ncbi:glycosyltransferase family 2 protein [Thioalkalivibrio sp. ALJ16]|uniref:glycosyltransferase family 2 protein n=1 Tax=Thioalkalivibrio sp. ALJ16 TaxID=1158762 RepID=UPI00036856BC|nr:glycosyltransferase family 2 protein [Thioalkalivibrio sp. ALJ16]